jgi:hypothetical protein
MRSLLATSFDQYRNTRSLLAISNNLESHLAIPFNQYEIWGPFWRPPLTNIEIRDPFWWSQTTWNPIWWFLLTNMKYEVPSGDLLWPISKYEIPSSDLKQFGIPSGDSFYSIWNMRSLLATSFDQYRNTRSLLAISNNLESHLAIPFI